MRGRAILAVIGSLLILVLFAAVWMREPNRMEEASVRQRLEALDRGAQLYLANCAGCHGQSGAGLAGPPLNLPRFQEEEEAEFLRKTIARGLPGTGMPPWHREEGGPLNSQQVDDLVTFIQYGDWGEAPPTPSRAAELGQQLFKQKCITCHQIGGEGGAVGPDLSEIGRQRELEWL
ncbi:MAG: c-type cytochrome, partial [Thermoplasmata archaeon]|nr:c-type cytochrome [Thermoplasmata archaeon]NIY05154.1 c-type cytochrome [Thermoplasmata archaeon]